MAKVKLDQIIRAEYKGKFRYFSVYLINGKLKINKMSKRSFKKEKNLGAVACNYLEHHTPIGKKILLKTLMEFSWI